eukprot:CAMPEP_0181309174 /NCGR_PEP_ID=MMETSP1101-20121128/11872_1 /TAXON_ID=46948 /ORGANISM="Rhodomonas abbreviata, Strain Caron Lab Isolate" /LENGTH=348 /DNA_ID=CAMNT_0023415639 /DNA_START=448 /DNA_END=1495 /DNA_ORIENTATION=-
MTLLQPGRGHCLGQPEPQLGKPGPQLGQPSGAHDELLQLLTIDGEPESLAEARQLPDWDLWWEACVEEWKSLKAMNTFQVVPVSHQTDLALAAQHGWYLNSTDIKVAFLAAELHEEIYMEPPEGFEELQEHFNLTDDSNLEWFLGVAYHCLPDGSIKANQTAYIEKCLRKFNLKKTNLKDYAFVYHGANATGRPAGEELYALSSSTERQSRGPAALQKIVALSSCESKYIQAALAAKEVLYLREILQLAGMGQCRTTMYIDNKAALDLSENPVQHGRSKHIGRQWHFLRECVCEGLLLTVAVEGKLNVADIFTKPLPKDAFEPFVTALSLACCDGTSAAGWARELDKR